MLDFEQINQTVVRPPERHLPASLPRLFEILQIRRGLILLRGHQQVIAAENIVLITDPDVTVVLGAIVLNPDRVVIALVVFVDRPRTRQGMVVDGDYVMQRVGVGLVDVEALRDDGLAVFMERDARRLVRARPFEAAGLDLKHVVAAVAILVHPLADGITIKSRLDFLGPRTPVRVDAARQRVVEEDVGRLWRNEDFHREDDRHDARQAERHASGGRVVSLAAGRLVRQAGLENLLIFRRERRLLAAAERLRLIPLNGDAGRPAPLARKIGIFRLIERPGPCDRQRHRRREGERSDRVSVQHLDPPSLNSAGAEICRSLAQSYRCSNPGCGCGWEVLRRILIAGAARTAPKTTASRTTLTLAARASVRTANRPPVYPKHP